VLVAPSESENSPRIASLGEEQCEHAYQCWLNRWKAHEAYSPEIEADVVDIIHEVVERVYLTLSDAGVDVLRCDGPR
jgi:hypothetical protein